MHGSQVALNYNPNVSLTMKPQPNILVLDSPIEVVVCVSILNKDNLLIKTTGTVVRKTE